MTFSKTATTISAMLLALASTANADETDWQFALEGLTLSRGGMDQVPLVVDGGGVLLFADDLKLGFGGGAKLTAYKNINSTDSIGIEFFFVDQMNASAFFAAPGAQLTVYGAAFGSSPISLEYGTDIYNLEVNWRRDLNNSPFRVIAGMRAIKIGEQMSVQDAASPPNLFAGDLENQMLGFQFGLEASAPITSRMTLDAAIKVGLYNDFGTFLATFPQAGPAARFYSEMSNSASTIELLLGVSYQISDRLSANIGYQAMMVNGIAVMPEQFDDLAVPLLGELDMGGSVVYQGVSLGVKYVW